MTTNSKEWIQYSTASLMIVSGVVLTFISFFVNGKKGKMEGTNILKQ